MTVSVLRAEVVPMAITALELLQTRHPFGCLGHWPSDSLPAADCGLSFAREVGRKARQQNLALPISLRAPSRAPRTRHAATARLAGWLTP
jgi:hypothetical protein